MSPIEVGRAKTQYNLADSGDIHSLEKSLGNDFVDRIAEANGTKDIKMTMCLENIGDDILVKDISRDLYKNNPINTEMIYNFELDGKIYIPDGRTVILKIDDSEKSCAEEISRYKGVKVNYIPRILNPENVRTPDFIIGEDYRKAKSGDFWDVKTPEGNSKNTIDTELKKGKGQAKNFIINIHKTDMTLEDAEKYIKYSMASNHRQWIDSVILAKDGKFIKVFKRKNKVLL